jgi:pilus assembly protein TadC
MSANLIQPSSFLRRVLWADAIVSAAVGVVMALGAGALHRLLGLPSSLLMVAGLALLPYAGYLVWLATRATVPRAAVWLPIVLNLVWAVDCVLVLAAAGLSPTWLGEAFVVLQIVTVLAFADLEFIGLRRALSLPRAARTHHA